MIFSIVGCNNDEQHEAEVAAVTYTCPMHPQIVQEKAGTCPICGMDLVLFDRSGKDESLLLDDRQIALANITTMVVGDSSISGELVLNGRVVADARNTEVIAARIGGRIERLFVRETGVQVTKGQPLFSIYSESLAALQEEYLVAAAQKIEFPDDEQFARIEQAARNKLLLLGQTPVQINRILETRKIEPTATYYSKVSGVVALVNIQQGAYVEEGNPVITLENYENVWVEADIYPGERNRIKSGDEVRVRIPGIEDEIKMKFDFVAPEYSDGSQQLQLRGSVSNRDRQLRPGMPAELIVPLTSSQENTIPVDAVIRDGQGEHIWIEASKGKFVPRKVTTGQASSDQVQILTGIKNGERVVASGAYLLYSEYLLKKGNIHLNNHQH